MHYWGIRETPNINTASVPFLTCGKSWNKPLLYRWRKCAEIVIFSSFSRVFRRFFVVFVHLNPLQFVTVCPLSCWGRRLSSVCPVGIAHVVAVRSCRSSRWGLTASAIHSGTGAGTRQGVAIHCPVSGCNYACIYSRLIIDKTPRFTLKTCQNGRKMGVFGRKMPRNRAILRVLE